MAQGLSYRGSYALIGVKDGAALAEQVPSHRNRCKDNYSQMLTCMQAFADGGPIAVATALYSSLASIPRDRTKTNRPKVRSIAA